jgi:cell division protein FtsL
VTNDQKLFREPDPRARRLFIAALTCSALLVGGALAVVGARVQQVHLAYRLDELRGQRVRAEANVRQLEIEVATLRAPARLETRARQLGMTAAGRDQIRLAREYVAGTTGLAAIRSRTASLSGGVEPGVRSQLQQ